MLGSWEPGSSGAALPRAGPLRPHPHGPLALGATPGALSTAVLSLGKASSRKWKTWVPQHSWGPSSPPHLGLNELPGQELSAQAGRVQQQESQGPVPSEGGQEVRPGWGLAGERWREGPRREACHLRLHEACRTPQLPPLTRQSPARSRPSLGESCTGNVQGCRPLRQCGGLGAGPGSASSPSSDLKPAPAASSLSFPICTLDR